MRPPFLLAAPLTARGSGARVAPAPASAARGTPTPYSTWMIQSIISREQGVVSSGAATSTLEAGITALALQAWLAPHAHPAPSSLGSQVSDYLNRVLDAVLPTFTTAEAATKLPLDRLTVGQSLWHQQHGQKQEDWSNRTAAEAASLAVLNTSLALQPRNAYGGFWYYVYPNWSYLDGTVSFLPFMALVDPAWSAADAVLQLRLLYAHCQDSGNNDSSSSSSPSGLLVHGYDASRTAVWANPVTGGSHFVWGRSLGWYLA